VERDLQLGVSLLFAGHELPSISVGLGGWLAQLVWVARAGWEGTHTAAMKLDRGTYPMALPASVTRGSMPLPAW
jgi:hypothetical protein